MSATPVNATVATPVATAPINSAKAQAPAQGQTYVEMKFADQSIQIPCKPEEKAELEKQVKILVKQMHDEAKKANLTDEQYMAKIMQAVPKEGTAKVMDKQA